LVVVWDCLGANVLDSALALVIGSLLVGAMLLQRVLPEYNLLRSQLRVYLLGIHGDRTHLAHRFRACTVRALIDDSRQLVLTPAELLEQC